MNNTAVQVRKLALTSMFIAIGLVLPFFTGQIKQIGNMLLPMHLPVLLCGLICGPWYGLVSGLVTPVLRSALFSVPPMFPTAAAMSIELGTYALVIGLMYGHSKWKCLISLYRSMIAAMVSGRLVWGLVMMVFAGLGGTEFSMKMFLAGAVLNAVPGIIIQLVLVPAIMIALGKTKMVAFSKTKGKSASND